MVRQVLQRAGADVLEQLGLHRDDGPPPPPPQAALDAIFRMPSGGPETEERQREREKAEEAHSAANPRGGTCGCGCRRFESTRTAAGKLAWVCGGCRQVYQPEGACARVRPAAPVAPPAPLPSPEAAREALKAAATAVEMAIAGHASLSNASTSVRAAVGAAERMHEEAEAALAEATRKARDATALALTTGQAAPAIDLGKARSEVEKAADGLLAARGAQEAIEAQQETARRALASAQAKGDEAALRVLAVEVGVPLVARTQALVTELAAALARLGWLSGRRAFWSPEVQALLALQGLPVRDWPMTAKIAAESDAALDRALPALVADPTVVVPAP